jgi:hypothetical protein
VRSSLLTGTEGSGTLTRDICPVCCCGCGVEAPRQLSRGRHPSLPYGRMPEFMADLRSREAVAARAVEFLILIGVRTDAVLKATWAQFDLAAGDHLVETHQAIPDHGRRAFS